MFEKNLFAQRLQHLRKTKNVSREQLAEALNLSYHSISKMEKAQRAASIEILCAMAEYFDVPVDYLLGKHGANLTEANLTEADMREVKACGAIFNKANLTNADLRNADLRWADFTDANLQGAKLEGAQLKGTIFTGANVSKTILEGKIVNGEYVE